MGLFEHLRSRVRNAARRQPHRFIVQLNQQARIVVAGTQALLDYMDEPSEENAARVRQYERQADAVRRRLVDDLNGAFVTPIDREDLFSLSRAIDDVLDYAYSTINELYILKVRPNPHLRVMAQLLLLSAREIDRAIQCLEHDPPRANKHAMRIKAIENRMEKLHAQALAALFQEPRDLQDVVEMMKLREIYRHMYHAVGSAEQAANKISDIRVKFY
jgi:uncharacterized protein